MKLSILWSLVIGVSLWGLVSCSHVPPVKETSSDITTEDSVSRDSLADYLARADWDRNALINLPEAVKFTLDNGLDIFCVERHDVPMVYARAQIRGGSIYDPPGKSGLAYLTGWVLTEGTEHFPDKTIDKMMDQRAAEVTSVAYNESCIATLTCLSKNFSELFPVFSEILSRAEFNADNLRDGRNYIIGDLMRTRDDPAELCSQQFRKDVFGTHPYSKPRKGTVAGLKSISREDVLNFYHTYYTPDRAVLVVVGDVDTEQLQRLCNQNLAQWSASQAPLPEVQAPEQVQGVHIHVVDKPIAQAQINMGFIGINRVNPDRFKLEVLNNILGGSGLFSRLGLEVRVKRGLTYGISSYFARREFTGEFIVNTFTKAETLGETVRIVLNELRRIRKEPVTDQELKDAKQSLIGSFPLQFERYEGIARALVHTKFYKLPMRDITHYPTYINAVTKSDILESARKYLHPDDIVITVVGPADTIVPQLEPLGTVTVVPGI